MIVSTDGEESRLIDDECELSMQHPATSEICGSQSDDVVHPICVKPDVERDHSVEAPGTEGSDLVVDTQTNAAIPQEGSSELIPANDICEEKGSEHDDERAEEETALQSERPVPVRTPRDRRMGYGEWVMENGFLVAYSKLLTTHGCWRKSRLWRKIGLRN